jgi:hypothetical protein
VKTLYFDIDGTLLLGDGAAVKSELRAGDFEEAVRSAGFSRLICVGNFAGVARAVRAPVSEYDALGVLFELCSLQAGAMRSGRTLGDASASRNLLAMVVMYWTG